MAGRYGIYSYTTDDNDTFAVSRDKSNADAIRMLPANANRPTPAIPRNIIPRVAVYEDSLTGAVRRLTVSTQAGLRLAPSTLTLDTVNGPTLFARVAIVPERTRRLKG